jgi:hypothetical protein
MDMNKQALDKALGYIDSWLRLRHASFTMLPEDAFMAREADRSRIG